MATYSAEPVAPEILKKQLSDNWQSYGGKVPVPEIIEINTPTEHQMRYNFQNRDYIFVQPDVTGEAATPRDTYRYWDISFNLVLTIYTMVSRQRLYDIKKEIRRILINELHDSTNNKYQLLLYKGFTELPQENLKIWRGQIKATLDSRGIYYTVA